VITRGKVKLSEGILHVFLAAIVMLNPADLDQVCIESQGILRGFFLGIYYFRTKLPGDSMMHSCPVKLVGWLDYLLVQLEDCP